MKKLRILVVDDERIIARDIGHLLQSIGHEVVGSVATGEEAVQLAGERRPDLVLMDIQLAGALDGIDAAHTIRRRWLIPVVFLTAFADDALVVRAASAGPCGYIVKPFNPRELHLNLMMAMHHHETEMRLRRSHELVSTILQTAMDGFWMFDAEGRLKEVNEAACALTGHSREDLLKRRIHDLVAAECHDRCSSSLAEAKVLGSCRCEIQIRRRDGSLLTLEASVTALPGPERNFAAFFRDITGRLAAEERMQQTGDELDRVNQRLAQSLARAEELTVAAETANRTKSAFLASMSHELRTPLNAINGVAATLVAAPPDPETAAKARLILDGGRTLLGIIEEILDYSGLQAGQPRLAEQSCDLGGVVAQAMQLVGELARQQQVQFDYSIAANFPARGITDPQRLLQILVNLLTNACRQSHGGRVHLGCTARAGDDGDVRLCFSVSDSGEGLSAEARGRLFRPFAAAEDRSKPHHGGVGLGLVIAQSYARLMQGDIIVRSKAGLGSVFRCCVQVRRDGANAALSRYAQPVLRGHRVLIVARDRRRRRLLTAATRGWGMEPVAEPNGSVAAMLPSLRRLFSVAIVDPASAPGFSPDARGAGAGVPTVWLGERPAGRPEAVEPLAVIDRPPDLSELSRALATLLAPAPGSAPAAAPRTAEVRPLRILAADDVSTNREMLRLMLRHLGYEVRLVEDGAAVLATLRVHPYDLVILDVEMPVMDGLTAAREIGRLFPDRSQRPRIVALTANALPGSREQCLAAGMDDYLTKPLLPVHLKACFGRLFPAAAETDATPAEASPAPAGSA